MTQGEEARFRGARTASIGPDVLHGPLKFDERNLGVLCRYLLVRSVMDAIAGELFPVACPVDAECAVAVIDQEWTRRLAHRRITAAARAGASKGPESPGRPDIA